MPEPDYSYKALDPETAEDISFLIRREFDRRDEEFSLGDQSLSVFPGEVLETAAPGAPGAATSEYGWTRWAFWGGAALAAFCAILTVLSAFGLKADLEYVSALVEIFQGVALTVGAYAISRGVAKKPASTVVQTRELGKLE